MYPPAVRFSSLPQDWQNFIRMMQFLNFGRLENLNVVDGMPQNDMSLVSVAEFRYAGDNCPSPEYELEDFVLRNEVVQFIEDLRALDMMTIKVVYVKHGLPFRMEVESLV